jgi:hypothetical protein
MLLQRIAAAVGKDSLEAVVRSLAGADVNGNLLTLDFGRAPNEFLRRQVKDNLGAIAEAASAVIGRPVQILLEDLPATTHAPHVAPAAPDRPADENVLERAKREPAVQSFLDTFPGPVRVENLKR